jgi:hypothetical protein
MYPGASFAPPQLNGRSEGCPEPSQLFMFMGFGLFRITDPDTMRRL